MRIKNYEDMNLQELDVMREISSIGTSHAATALSKLLQKEIRIWENRNWNKGQAEERSAWLILRKKE